MLLTYSLNDEKQMKKWDQFVCSHPGGTPFHSSEWLKCIENTYHYKPLLYVATKNSGTLEGIFPCFHVRSYLTGSRLVSIPFSDYGGPLFYDKSEENRLLSRIIENFNNSYKYLEIRSNLENGSKFLPHSNFKLHTLQLNPHPELVKQNFNKRTTLYSIRKAKKEGVKIREQNTLTGIEAFYRLNTLTRKKHGLPPQPFVFMKNLYNHLIAKGDASLLLATHGTQIIGAGIFIKFRDTVYYKYNASDPAFLSQKKPNHLLTWHAIKQACYEGFQYFDFGRTAVNNPGLSRYKELWGAKPLDLPYHFYPDIQRSRLVDENKPLYRMFRKFCRKLPDILLKQIGAKIYKHIG